MYRSVMMYQNISKILSFRRKLLMETTSKIVLSRLQARSYDVLFEEITQDRVRHYIFTTVDPRTLVNGSERDHTFLVYGTCLIDVPRAVRGQMTPGENTFAGFHDNLHFQNSQESGDS